MENKKSYWTGKVSTHLVDLNTEFLPEFHRPYEVVYVEVQHEQKLKDTLLWMSRSWARFYTFIIFGIIGLLVGVMGYEVIAALLVMLTGIGFVIYPFSTPMTAEIYGLRSSFYIIRVFGLVMAIMGLYAAFYLAFLEVPRNA